LENPITTAISRWIAPQIGPARRTGNAGNQNLAPRAAHWRHKPMTG
jgi:hypothetical protein